MNLLSLACEIAQRLFTQPLTDFEGRYYQLKQARCEPKAISLGVNAEAIRPHALILGYPAIDLELITNVPMVFDPQVGGERD